MEILDGNNIADFYKFYECDCVFNGVDIAPQNITYYFNTNTLNKKSLINAISEKLATKIQQPVQVVKSLKGDFALQIPRKKREILNIKDTAETLKQAPPLSAILGKDSSGNLHTIELKDCPHMLVAGTTGGGKTVALNSIIMSLCCYNTPKELGVILIDPKRTEFEVYRNLPHLEMDIITEVSDAKLTLLALVEEMEERYQTLQKNPTANFKTLLVVIDELCDLVLSDEEIKKPLKRLLRLARACKIHLIVATQSPRAKILDGELLANLPTRLALTCASARESILILGKGGAEKLQGKGDALLKTQKETQEIRIQCPLITKEQIVKLLNK
jgi:DNA segregation ATPase FtsK/SpoIIIE, S-DNA-T family